MTQRVKSNTSHTGGTMNASTEFLRFAVDSPAEVLQSLERMERLLGKICESLANPVPSSKVTWMSEAAVARYLSVSRRTLQHWRLQGGGPKYSKAGSGVRAAVRYTSTDVDKWLKARSRSLTAEH